MPTAPTPDAATLAAWERAGLVPPGTAATLRRKGDRTPRRAKVAPAGIVDPGARQGPKNEGTDVGQQMPCVRVVVTVPVKTVSEANAGGRLRDAMARKSMVKAAVRSALPQLVTPLGLPVVVTLTRVGTGTKPLDDDNLRRALKAVRDVVAEWLQCDDGDKRVRWRYRQRRGWSPAVVIDVRQRGC